MSTFAYFVFKLIFSNLGDLATARKYGQNSQKGGQEQGKRDRSSRPSRSKAEAEPKSKKSGSGKDNRKCYNCDGEIFGFVNFLVGFLAQLTYFFLQSKGISPGPVLRRRRRLESSSRFLSFLKFLVSLFILM